MRTFKTPNGKATVTVPENQVKRLEDQGFKEVKKPKRDGDRKASKQTKDTAKTKAISEVKSGDDRTR